MDVINYVNEWKNSQGEWGELMPVVLILVITFVPFFVRVDMNRKSELAH
jgi:hypothetical protein